MIVSAEYREVPMRDVKDEFHAYGIRPTINQLIDFAVEFELELHTLKDREVEPALWYAVRQMSRLLAQGKNFDQALREVKWASRRSGLDKTPISRVRKMHRQAPKDPRRERNKVQIRLRELIDTFIKEQRALSEEYDSTLNPFKRRRLVKTMRSLDDFLYNDATEILKKEFQGSPYIYDLIKDHAREGVDKLLRAQAAFSRKGKWDPKKFRRWVGETLFELEEVGRNRESWQKAAIDILRNNQPSRRDSADRMYSRAVSLYRELEAHGDPTLSDLAIDIRSQFGVGK